MSNWQSAKKQNPMWNPCTKKNADGEVIPLEKTSKSFIEGYYLGMDTIPGKKGDIVIHNLKLREVGDVTHMSEEAKPGDDVSLWGKSALDSTLHKNVPIGTMCRIEWEGKENSKSNPGQKYHIFDVKYDSSDTLALKSESNGNAGLGAQGNVPVKEVAKTSPAAGTAIDDEDDDLPF